MEKVSWGIIGCGVVAEVKSGPAFQNCKNSELFAVMRRNGKKAEDFARRHKVPYWYDNVEELLQDNRINAVYIATPPSSHLNYTLQAIEAGKHIYLEKPMALSVAEAEQIRNALKGRENKLTVAHYRRKLPAFLKVKELLAANRIGVVRFADVKILQSSEAKIIANTEENWRVDPEISGGGYFYDLAPHQLDLMFHYFGEIAEMRGFSKNQAKLYPANDIVQGIISFRSGIQFRGIWAFNISEKDNTDNCTIYGCKGQLSFSFFGDRVSLKSVAGNEDFHFKPIEHVQGPMIQATVEYFMDKNTNPCSVEEGLEVMKIMNAFR
ncbi:Gfo/Idh/MocA family protein [Autumnicola musiva]|uniref:Gfo/Idh/MocA family oxidoreductase n=1 Tax=Autumnicola musiva TaxID=3075589 RepID=A0ABU3DAR5_9FLAO|nr:Gfo/Idh/MocA family oxidoreductase [Zunongwangia sp. F117]MDT0678628.1 Gfo/Idh/MocA family oxidoreductase [Zunongwangia sp. F117]